MRKMEGVRSIPLEKEKKRRERCEGGVAGEERAEEREKNIVFQKARIGGEEGRLLFFPPFPRCSKKGGAEY